MKKIIDQEIRWGILGVGNVCEVKSAPAMQLIPQSKIVAVMRRNAENRSPSGLETGQVLTIISASTSTMDIISPQNNW